jgi:hypothetical protein
LPATRGTGSSVRIEASETCRSSASIVHRASLRRHASAAVAGRDHRIDFRVRFLRVSQVCRYHDIGRHSYQARRGGSRAPTVVTKPPRLAILVVKRGYRKLDPGGVPIRAGTSLVTPLHDRRGAHRPNGTVLDSAGPSDRQVVNLTAFAVEGYPAEV